MAVLQRVCSIALGQHELRTWKLAINYCQELAAYWFLRLNGFLVVENFVIHRAENYAKSVGEVDLLAVRERWVFEPVGGSKGDWHPIFLDGKLGVTVHDDGSWSKRIALIVEAKGGGTSKAKLLDSLSSMHVCAGLQRIGVLEKDAARAAARQIAGSHGKDVGKDLVAAKLVVFNEQKVNAKEEKLIRAGPWLAISTFEVNDFLWKRVSRYRAEKRAGWHLFPRDLFQFLIWSQDHWNPAP